MQAPQSRAIARLSTKLYGAKPLYTSKHMFMFMAVKTITITEDAYKILAEHKLNEESFSELFRRVFANRKSKTIHHFFGIIDEKIGDAMQHDLEKIREKNIHLLQSRIK